MNIFLVGHKLTEAFPIPSPKAQLKKKKKAAKQQKQNETNNKWGNIKLKNFYTSKETNNKMKSQLRKWEKVFV